MMPTVSGVNAEREYDTDRAVERVVEPVVPDHARGAGHRLRIAAHHRDVGVERTEEAQQRLGDAAAADDGDLAVEQIRPVRWCPGRRPRIPIETA